MPPRKKQDRRRPIEFDISRGEWRGGDAATTPVGHARRLRNVVLSDGVWVGRPQFTYDGVDNIVGLAMWNDEATGTTRLVAVRYADGSLKVKATSGETYASVAASIYGTALYDYTNLNGRVYGTMIYPVALYGNSEVFFHDGTAAHYYTELSGPLHSPLHSFSAYALESFIERLFIGGITHRILNKLLGVTDFCYDPANWTLTNIVTSVAAALGRTTYSITPTTTTARFHFHPLITIQVRRLLN